MIKKANHRKTMTSQKKIKKTFLVVYMKLRLETSDKDGIVNPVAQ